MKKILLSLAMVVSAVFANAQCNTQPYVKHITGAVVSAPSSSYTYLNTPYGSSVQVGRDNTPEVFDWVNDTIYVIHGILRVDSLDVLNIEKGTVIMGADQGTLIIQRGGQIFAQGTRQLPIVFTSFKCPGQRAAGDWGGLVLCGAARNNIGTNVQLEGGYGAFHGGSSPTSNSGVLQYVRIEFGGTAIFPNQEINALTMGSVGSGTKISYVQCSYNLDDAFEWFGGTVNTRYICSFKNLDDDFDASDGYVGLNQFGMAVRDPNLADISQSNGFEIDNNGAGNTATPITSPVFSNYTVMGPMKNSSAVFSSLYGRGAHIRKNSAPKIVNSVIAGWPIAQVVIDGQGSTTSAVNDVLKIRNSVVAPFSSPAPVQTTAGTVWTPYADVMDWYDTPTYKDSIYNTTALLKIRNAYDLANPNYTLTLLSNLRYGADFTDPATASPFFFKNGTFRGCMGPGGNWTNTWTEWDPQNFAYNNNGVVRQGAVSDVAPIAASIYPNPTQGKTSVSFSIEETTEVEISVMNMQGVKVKDVVKNIYSRGDHTETFDITGLTTGLYLVNVKSDKGSESVILSVE